MVGLVPALPLFRPPSFFFVIEARAQPKFQTTDKAATLSKVLISISIGPVFVGWPWSLNVADEQARATADIATKHRVVVFG